MIFSKKFFLGILILTTKGIAMFEATTYSGEQIAPILPLIQAWGERDYLSYPYLWAPPKGEIYAAFALWPKEKDSIVVVVKDKGEVVGIAAGGAFDAKLLQELFDGLLETSLEEPLLKKVENQGFDPSKILYMSCFLTAPQLRNDEDLVELIYGACVDFAHKIGKSQICYFEDLGKPDHPLKPEVPAPIEPWGTVIPGTRSMGIRLDIVWDTLQKDGSIKDEVHTNEFFIKDL